VKDIHGKTRVGVRGFVMKKVKRKWFPQWLHSTHRYRYPQEWGRREWGSMDKILELRERRDRTGSLGTEVSEEV